MPVAAVAFADAAAATAAAAAAAAASPAYTTAAHAVVGWGGNGYSSGSRGCKAGGCNRVQSVPDEDVVQDINVVLEARRCVMSIRRVQLVALVLLCNFAKH